MAATIFQSLICLIILSSISTPVHIFSTHSRSSSSLQQNLPKFLATECLLQILTAPKIISLTGSVGFHRNCYAVGYWSKHGYISLCIPGHDPPINITIYNDVSSNPGPQSSILDYEHDQSEINDHSKFNLAGRQVTLSLICILLSHCSFAIRVNNSWKFGVSPPQ